MPPERAASTPNPGGGLRELTRCFAHVSHAAHPRQVDCAAGRLSRTQHHEGEGRAGAGGIGRKSGQSC